MNGSVVVGWGFTPYFQQQWLTVLDEQPKLAGTQAGRVSSVRRGDCLVVVNQEVPRRAVLAGRFAEETEVEHLCVGDFVLVDWKSGTGVIKHLFSRASLFRRKAAGPTSRPQPIAANIDLAIVVCALTPDSAGARASQRGVNVRRIERYLAAIAQAGVRPLIAVNKSDLRADASEIDAAALQAEVGGVEVLLVSAHSGAGVAGLDQRLWPGATAVLVGSSGVGKSSLTNRLLGCEVQRAEAVRADDSRGRHTTTARELFALPNGAFLIDTPGMRAIALVAELGDDRSLTGFADIEALANNCRFRDCRHEDEPGCAVRKAIERGDLASARLDHARKLERELRRLDAQSNAATKSKQRQERRHVSRKTRGAERSKWKEDD